jgi:hypothetical protein
MTFWGLSYLVWVVLCLLVAGVFTVIWPKKKVTAAMGPLRYFLLRWAHVLVWVLLALGLFISGLTDSGLGNPVALLALPVYLAFLGALLVK